MNADLKTFLFSMLRVVLPALLLVAVVAFTTIPFVLGHHLGDVVPTTSEPRHFT